MPDVFGYLSAWQQVRHATTSRRKLAPPRVDTYDNGERYWIDPPPVVSARCRWWMDRIREGWRPSSRVASFGYYGLATYLGVYIWEYLHVVYPLLWPAHVEWAVTDDGCPVRLPVVAQ